jgi:hypothetical protein
VSLVTKSAAFRRWFGQSAVVDAQDRPLVVHHGTTAQFDAFRPFVRKGQQLGFGIHFTEDESLASLYAHGNGTARRGKHPRVVDVFLSVHRPLYANEIALEGTPEFALAKKLAGRRFLTQADHLGRRMTYVQNALDMTAPDRAAKLIQEAGYDGVRYLALLNGFLGLRMYREKESVSWIVFSPTQIKSDTANRGTFDPTDESILNPSRRR